MAPSSSPATSAKDGPPATSAKDEPQPPATYDPLSKPEWISLPTEEPLSPEMKEEVMVDLRKEYHLLRIDDFRRDMKYCWIYQDYIVPPLKSSTRIPTFDSTQLRRICNKPTALYWAHAAQVDDWCPGLTFGCIYKKWFCYHDNEPSIEFGHFFAEPVRITSTGPTTITGILEAHRTRCYMASSLLGKIARGEAGEAYMSHWPDPQEYKLLPLYQALIVILDELAEVIEMDTDGSVSLDEMSQRQSVLMVLTGEESYLSAPISFESIRGESLPLAKSDLDTEENTCAVRVSLATAVRFIADLERREEAAFPNMRDLSLIDKHICPSIDDARHAGVSILSADAYAEGLMQMAEEKGIDNTWETRESVRRVKAAKRGEVYAEHIPYRFNDYWK
ncbi:MAG: hypothetical protein M1837_004086 [Sclerophora amabilis]|nr:MAG: hypothetical protein M1837_004086 [Sclerophora amabilis]